MCQPGIDELRRWRALATEVIAAEVEADPDAGVPAYDGWTLRDLALHVIRIYGNASIALRSGSLERPRPEPTVAREDDPVRLGEAVRAALAEVEEALAARASGVVWTPVGPRDAYFWQHRILREAVLHRWDAQEARGAATAPEAPEALTLVDEFLDTDVARALAGGDDPGAGVVAIDAGTRRWRVDLGRTAVAMDAPIAEGAASIDGDPSSIWLWLMRRDASPGPVVIDDTDGSVAAFVGLIDRFNRAKR